MSTISWYSLYIHLLLLLLFLFFFFFFFFLFVVIVVVVVLHDVTGVQLVAINVQSLLLLFSFSFFLFFLFAVIVVVVVLHDVTGVQLVAINVQFIFSLCFLVWFVSQSLPPSPPPFTHTQTHTPPQLYFILSSQRAARIVTVIFCKHDFQYERYLKFGVDSGSASTVPCLHEACVLVQTVLLEGQYSTYLDKFRKSKIYFRHYTV